MTDSTILYTLTDEAPALATRSLLPIVEAFAGAADVAIESRDISLASRVLAAFADLLPEEQRVSDDLAELGAIAQDPGANIIKLPNISASVPQLEATIEELRARGYDLPDFPDDPSTPEERGAASRYSKVMGSAVNPVLREGNSDRRAPASVKEYARKYPHSMGEWSYDSKTHVSTMSAGDFRHNEQSVTLEKDSTLRIEHVDGSGEVTVLKDGIELAEGTVVDGTFMSAKALIAFLKEQVAEAREQGVLLSLHMKATMMKVSDPLIFGHAVRAYFEDVFAQYGDTLDRVGANPNNGLASVIDELDELPEDERTAILDAIEATYLAGPALAMVNSDRGITNLHVPSDVIIDASMPAMIRSSGKMWNAAGETQDTKAVIPDSTYADLYAETIEYVRHNGAFDPRTMGTVPNVGLMARKAEEYGSHDKTFEIDGDGMVRVVDHTGAELMTFEVETGDIWRMGTVMDIAVKDWVGLAVRRARATNTPAVFWLDHKRPHDAQLIPKVKEYLRDHDTKGLEIHIMPVDVATRYTLERTDAGFDTISVTGNVLRDYLTDLFPILELGTSAKMLSIVPLMNGGGLFETGAGGSAPKHVQQFVAENHLRWDSLGEFLALAESFEHYGEVTNNPKAEVLAKALDRATGRLLQNGKSPSRKVRELDNRGSHFYLALYWAQEMATQTEDKELATRFAPLAKALLGGENAIVEELNRVQGEPVDIGGYYAPDEALVSAAMRPSATFNDALAAFTG